MAVFPAASRQHVPPAFGELMCDPDSNIIDFYPTDFKVDLNGKKFAWMGVALLPFVDERRLLRALQTVYSTLTPEEQHRNRRSNDRLFMRADHSAAPILRGLYEDATVGKEGTELDTNVNYGIAGLVRVCELASQPGDTVPSAVLGLCPDLLSCNVISSLFDVSTPTVFSSLCAVADVCVSESVLSTGFHFSCKTLANCKNATAHSEARELPRTLSTTTGVWPPRSEHILQSRGATHHSAQCSGAQF